MTDPSVPLSAIRALVQQWETEVVEMRRLGQEWANQKNAINATDSFSAASATEDCANELAALCPAPPRPLCVCGHDAHYHEDAEGGTHECWYPGCSCQQFVERA